MGLVDLWVAKPDWSTFWFNNWIGHQGIVQAISRQMGVSLTMYPIDPWVEGDMENILEMHQEYHNEMNQVLGTGGQDLSIIDFEDPEAVQQWVSNNFLEHQSVNAILKL